MKFKNWLIPLLVHIVLTLIFVITLLILVFKCRQWEFMIPAGLITLMLIVMIIVIYKEFKIMYLKKESK